MAPQEKVQRPGLNVISLFYRHIQDPFRRERFIHASWFFICQHTGKRTADSPCSQLTEQMSGEWLPADDGTNRRRCGYSAVLFPEACP